MLAGHFVHLAKRKYPVLDISVSYDNLNFEVPLTQRFMANDIVAIIADPVQMTAPSKEMQLRGEIRYLDSFFQPDTILQKARELVGLNDQSADSHFILYRALRQNRQLDQGLAELERAAELDPVYANEFI